MKKKIISRGLHLLLFVGVELLFVFIILRELPSVSLMSTIGIVHMAYWALIIIAGVVRESLHHVWQRILASYLPVLLHVAGHIFVMFQTVEHVHEQMEHAHEHEPHSLVWLVVATISVGIIIVVGEYLLHRKLHCDHCHHEFHEKKCGKE